MLQFTTLAASILKDNFQENKEADCYDVLTEIANNYFDANTETCVKHLTNEVIKTIFVDFLGWSQEEIDGESDKEKFASCFANYFICVVAYRINMPDVQDAVLTSDIVDKLLVGSESEHKHYVVLDVLVSNLKATKAELSEEINGRISKGILEGRVRILVAHVAVAKALIKDCGGDYELTLVTTISTTEGIKAVFDYTVGNYQADEVLKTVARQQN